MCRQTPQLLRERSLALSWLPQWDACICQETDERGEKGRRKGGIEGLRLPGWF
jgi:hypothetical protein